MPTSRRMALLFGLISALIVSMVAVFRPDCSRRLPVQVAVGADSSSLALQRTEPAPKPSLSNPDPQTTARARAAYVELPLSFEANRGQADERVKFLSRGAGYGISLTANEAVLKLRGADRPSTLRMRLLDSNPTPRIEAVDQLPGKVNYLVGNTAAQWQTGIPTFARVRYEQVYPGVNLVFYGNQRRLEYDFVVAPNADAGRIRLAFDGARRMRVDDRGDLLLEVAGGEVRQHRPVVYQETNGGKQTVEGRYVVEGRNEVGFELGDYDRDRELVIDPVLSYSTFLGGSGGDQGNGIAVDGAGNVYVTGHTLSSDFPASAPRQRADSDVFVTKLSPSASSGNLLVAFTTVIGGRDDDRGQAVAVDGAGNIYVTGATNSTAFPAQGGYQNTFGSAAVFKSASGGDQWSPSGSGLAASVVNHVLIDPADASRAYAATASGGVFKTTDGGGAWAQSNGSADPARFTALGSNDVRALALDPKNPSVIYAATAGGVFRSANGGADWSAANGAPVSQNRLTNTDVRAVVVDPNDSMILYAATAGGVFRSANGGADWDLRNQGLASVNVAALAVAGNPAILYAALGAGGVFRSADGGANWSARNGGLAGADVRALAIDPGNPAKLYAGTPAGLFTTSNGGESWSRASGGVANANIRALAIDATNSSVVYTATASGVFKSANGGTSWSASNSGQTSTDVRALAARGATLYLGAVGGNDAFLLKLSPGGSSPLYSTFIGGGGNDQGAGLSVDASGNAYVTGTTASTNFKTAGGLANRLAGATDAFVVKVNTAATGEASLVYGSYLGGSGNDQGAGIAVDASGNAYVTGATSSADFPTTANAFRTRYGNSAVFKSADGAGNWSAGGGITGDVVSVFAIAPNAIYAGNVSGVFKSTDNGDSWSAKNTGLANTDVRAIVVDPANAMTLYAATGGGVFKSVNGGDGWSAANNGLTRLSVRALAIDAGGALYAGTAFGGVFKSANGGTSWSPSNGPVSNDPHAGCQNCLPNTTPATGESLSSIQAMVVAPASPPAIYVSVVGAGVFKSANAGGAWTPANTGLPGVDAATGLTTRTIRALAASQSSPNTIFAVTEDGVFKSVNGGGAWAASSTGLASRDIRALAVGPKNAEAVYAATADGVFKSANGGGSWSLSNTGLTAVVVNALAIDPNTTANLYVGSGAGPGDAFVAKLNTAGSQLLYSTFLGGAANDSANGIALDQAGNAYVTGATSSQNFPTTPNALSSSHRGKSDAFVARLNTTVDGAASLVYSTFLGGGDAEQGNAVAVDGAGRVYVTGLTSSTDFPLFIAISNLLGGAPDAFVTAIGVSDDGSPVLSYSTFLSGVGPDAGLGIAAGSDGSAYVTGSTSSPNFPATANAADRTCGAETDGTCRNGSDAFIARIINSADSADLALTKTHTGTFRTGQRGVFNLTVRNNGPSLAAGPLRVIDALPEGLSFVSATGDGWGCTVTGQIVSCVNQTALAANASTTINLMVNVSPGAASSLTNTASVSSATSDPVVNNNTARDTVAVDASCVFTISPSGQSFPPEGGTGSVTVTTQSDCEWEAAPNSPFITVSGSGAGRGNGAISFTVAANPGSAGRTGTLAVAGQTFTVIQSGVCTLSLSPETASVAGAGGAGSLSVNAPEGCAWQAAVDAPAMGFVRITSGNQGSGAGTITFVVSPNQTSGERRATLTVTGKTFTGARTFTITQSESGCNYSLSPATAAFKATGGDGAVEVTSTKDTCDWTVTSNDGFITVLSDREQSGDKVFVIYKVAPNPANAARTGTMTIAGQTFTVTQEGRAAPAACAYSLTIQPSNQSFTASGGSGSLSVMTQDGCPWQAASSDPGFIAITAGQGSGAGTVAFSVSPNAGATVRVGTITVAGQSVVITQSASLNPAACSFTINPVNASFSASGGDGAIFVAASLDGCQWSAISDAGFVTFRNDAGMGANQIRRSARLDQTGTAYVVYEVAPNTGATARTAALSVAGHTFTITQAGRPAQAAVERPTTGIKNRLTRDKRKP